MESSAESTMEATSGAITARITIATASFTGSESIP